MIRAWKGAWFERGVRVRAASLWRGVEAQHVVSTMRLADSLEEQRVLEELLETSKPALPPEARGRHYLLFTPFRYRSPAPSRFRRAADPGVWHGAEALQTACGAVAHWKWRFLADSEALSGRALHTEHPFCAAQARRRCAELTAAPWKAAAHAWGHKSEYAVCQDLADQARRRAAAWIRYAPVRVPRGACGAVLALEALALAEPFERQTWAWKTSRSGAHLRRAGGDGQYEFSAVGWE